MSKVQKFPCPEYWIKPTEKQKHHMTFDSQAFKCSLSMILYLFFGYLLFSIKRRPDLKDDSYRYKELLATEAENISLFEGDYEHRLKMAYICKDININFNNTYENAKDAPPYCR